MAKKAKFSIKNLPLPTSPGSGGTEVTVAWQRCHCGSGAEVVTDASLYACGVTFLMAIWKLLNIFLLLK